MRPPSLNPALLFLIARKSPRAAATIQFCLFQNLSPCSRVAGECGS